MATTSEIRRAENEVNSEEEVYNILKSMKKLTGYFALTSLAGFVYLGVRAIFGANIGDILNIEPKTVLQTIDQLAGGIGSALTVTSIAFLAYHFEERDGRKNVENAEENLRRIKEDYAFSRGHL